MDSGFMTHLNPKCWYLMPQVMTRIRNFSIAQDGHGDPDLWLRTVEYAFGQDDPDLVVVVVEDNGQVIAHSLCGIEQHLGYKWVMVYQYEFDRALPREVTLQYMNMIEQWGRRKGAQEWRALVEGPVRERAFRALYGFKPYRTIMVKPFPKEE